jgi:hypothetical protein
MDTPSSQAIEHCPRFPEHCSLECMEKMRAEFACYTLSEPPFEEWCPFAKAAHRQDNARKSFEAQALETLHAREFPEDAPRQ